MKRWIAFSIAVVMLFLSVPVTVFAGETDAVESIALEPQKVTVSEETVYKLNLTIKPEDALVKKVSWESSNPEVAKLTGNGEILAVAPGTTTVSVCVEGYPEGTKYTDECYVTVKKRISGEKTVTVPEGATAQLFNQKGYYSCEEIKPSDTVINEDHTVTYYYSSVKSNLSWRVTGKGMRTKAGYWNGDPVVITADSVPEQKNSHVNENGVFLNINSRNCLHLSEGQEYLLKAYRTWEIVDDYTTNLEIMPDFTFDILSGENVVSLQENPAPTNGSSWTKTLKAIGTGTAVIEVSYDAIDIFGGELSGTYGACDESRRGLFLVQVEKAAQVDFNIDCFSSMRDNPVMKGTGGYIPYNGNDPKTWDAELDTLYFTGENGTLTFTPKTQEAIRGVYVSHDKGGSYQTLTSGNGTYTASIVPGNNILKVDTDSGTAYQVVRGDRLQVEYSKISGSSGTKIQAGDTVRVWLNGLHQPFPKLSGIYNPGAVTKDDGKTYWGAVHLNYSQGNTHVFGPGAQYDFITAANYVDVTVPSGVGDGEKVVLTDGYIGVGVFGRNDASGNEVLTGRSHRSMETAITGTTSIQSYHTRSILPEVEIRVGDQTQNRPPVVKADAERSATVKKGENYTVPNLNAWFSDPEGKSLIFTVSVNGAAETGISGRSYTYQATGEGTVELVFRATDGEAFSEGHTVKLTVEKADSENSSGTGSSTGTGSGTGSSGSNGSGSSGSGTASGNGTNVTPGGSTGKKEYGLSTSEIAGYVTVSFEDNGVRLAEEKDKVTYPEPLGTIVASTKVPFRSGDSIADVTKRLLDELGIGYVYGTTDLGLYLSSIKNFKVNNTRYSALGEFDSGRGSGWMITLNGWFINKSSDAFQVKNGDVIRWQYTCQLGTDIGNSYNGSSQNGGQNGNQSGSSTAGYTVAEVEKLIQNLPDAITGSNEAQVKEAYEAYMSLSAGEREQVSGDLVQKLNQARAVIGKSSTTQAQKSEAEKVEALIDGIGTPVTLDTEPAIAKARQAYDALTEAQKYLIGNYEKLISAEQALVLLKQAGTPEARYLATGEYLEQAGIPNVGSIGGEWTVIGLLRSGREIPGADTYWQRVCAYVQENINEKNQLHKAKSTDNSRIILALTAMGKDPRNVAGYDLLQGLTDLEYVQYQGINGPIWALLAFDSGNYAVPGGSVTREALLETVLQAQLSDGGWALAGETGDPDMTGMALQALAPYYGQKDSVKAAVERALTKLSQMQAGNGGFASIDGENCESAAQVVAALTALGIDPDRDERFIKNGNSVWDALLTYAVPGGGFCHVPEGERDGMSTEQGYYAMVSYYRFLEKKTSLFDMTDIADWGGDPVRGEETEAAQETSVPAQPVKEEAEEDSIQWLWIGMLGLCVCALTGILLNRKKLLDFLSRE